MFPFPVSFSLAYDFVIFCYLRWILQFYFCDFEAVNSNPLTLAKKAHRPSYIRAGNRRRRSGTFYFYSLLSLDVEVMRPRVLSNFLATQKSG